MRVPAPHGLLLRGDMAYMLVKGTEDYHVLRIETIAAASYQPNKFAQRHLNVFAQDRKLTMSGAPTVQNVNWKEFSSPNEVIG